MRASEERAAEETSLLTAQLGSTQPLLSVFAPSLCGLALAARGMASPAPRAPAQLLRPANSLFRLHAKAPQRPPPMPRVLAEEAPREDGAASGSAVEPRTDEGAPGGGCALDDDAAVVRDILIGVRTENLRSDHDEHRKDHDRLLGRCDELLASSRSRSSRRRLCVRD